MQSVESEGTAMASMKDMKLDELFNELRGEASKRASDIMGEGKTQVRRAVGGHDDTALFGTFALGIIVGALVGAVIALMVTPYDGGEARRRIGRRVDRMRAGEPDWQRTGNGQPVGSAQGGYPGAPSS